MAAPRRLVLSDAEVGALVAVARVTPSTESPLRRANGAPSRDALALLHQKRMVDASGRLLADWREPVTTLASPRARYRLRLMSPNNDLAGADYYIADDDIVSWASQNDAHIVATSVEPAEVLSVVAGWMRTDGLPTSAQFSGGLSPDEFTAFVACVDAYREERMLAMIDRRAVQPNIFIPSVLFRQLEMSPPGDARWLAGIVVRFRICEFTFTRDALANGLAGLQRRGWIAWHEKGVEILAPLEPLCEDLGTTLPCVASEMSSAVRSDAFVAVRGRSAFWIFEEAPGRQGAMITATNGEGLMAAIDTQIGAFSGGTDRPRTATPRASEPPVTPEVDADDLPLAAPAPVATKAPKQPAVPAAKATTSAPAVKSAAAKAGPSKCTKCGTPLKPGKKFCTKCGTKVA